MLSKSIRDLRGFSLVEMMIGLTISMMIIGAFINLLINQNKSATSEGLRQDMSLSGRVALDEIQREAMNAGTGLPGLFSSVQVFDGGSDPDTITFLYIPVTDINLKFAASPKPNANANAMKLSADSDIDSLNVGEHLIIFDESDFNVIEISQINISSKTVNFVPPASVYNLSSGLAKAYNPPTTTVARVSIMSITVDQSDLDHPQLVKFKGSTNLGSVASDIQDMQVVIQFEDGDTASSTDDSDGDNTNDMMDLRAVEVTLTARSSRPDTDRNQEGDHYWRQEFTALIAPRNVIY